MNGSQPVEGLLPRGDGSRMAIVLLLTLFAFGLGWAAWLSYLERSCTHKQWPDFDTCEQLGKSGIPRDKLLQDRITRNPGDSAAWIELAVLLNNAAPTDPRTASVLDTATKLAGEDPRVQRMQAVTAIRQQQWPRAVDWLVRLVRDGGDAGAAVALASLLPEPKALAALQTQLDTGAAWLAPVIGGMAQAKVPLVMAMPLVVRAQAQKQLPPEFTQQLIRDLKLQGQWLDAHALWVTSLNQGPVSVLFNGAFDTGFLPGGFDWEITPAPESRAGALVRQAALANRGGVLQIEFTGRPVVVPMLQQHMVLLYNRYELTGQFTATQLKSDEGLVWVLKCAGDGREIARSAGLKDTAGQWRPFKMAFDLPSGCGPAVALQLHTSVPYEASSGLRGQVMFDDFKLEVRT